MLKYLFIKFLLLLLIPNTVIANNRLIKGPYVDLRVEIVSIVSRLAEYEEYKSDRFPKYSQHIDQYFLPFKEHEMIKFAKKIRQENFIGFDALARFSILIKPIKGEENEILVFDQPFPEKFEDERWNREIANQYLLLLNRFYKETKFFVFFKQSTSIYDHVIKNFLIPFSKFNVEWYLKFYQKNPDEDFHVVLAVNNGYSNYGPTYIDTNGKKNNFAILGTPKKLDQSGFPLYEDRSISTLVHEFNHSFVNISLQKNLINFEKIVNSILPYIKDNLNLFAMEGSKSYVLESLTYAATTKYLKDNNYPFSVVQESIFDSINRGLYGFSDLVLLLEEYSNNKKLYSSFEDFIPRLVVYFKKLSSQISGIKQKTDKLRPKVLKIYPQIENRKIDVSELMQFDVEFDQPLFDKSVEVLSSVGGLNSAVEVTNIEYDSFLKKVTIHLKLEKNKKYDFLILGRRSYKSKYGFGTNPYKLSFITK